MGEALTAIGERQPFKVGIEPARHVSRMENHDEACYIWRGAGVKQRVLVHVDAHHDMWWIGDEGTVTIANFICPALKEDLVREVFWVVPDATFESAQSRKPVLAHLKTILKKYPAASRAPVVEEHRITASVLGKKLSICPLQWLPAMSESVLLDIDVDYLVIPRVTYGENDRHGLLPWRWPSELLGLLRGISSDLVTLVYSVEGGYTPLEWKYLGDELILRLKKPGGGGADLEGMARMREGAQAEVRGAAAEAESQYRQAMDLLPASAAAPYRLARLLARQGRVEEGRRLYGQAVALDGSYQGAYSSVGFQRYRRLEFQAAEQEFRDTLVLDPEDVYSRYGLGLLAKKRRRWEEAEQHLRAALAGDDCLVGAQRVLGDVLVKQGKKQEALAAYERTLNLGQMGYKPLSGPILTHTRDYQILDPLHGDTHIRLAALYEWSGATAKAITALRMGITAGFGGVEAYLRLARLYARQRQWRKSAGQIWQAAKASPQDARWGYERLRGRLQRKIKAALGKGRGPVGAQGL